MINAKPLNGASHSFFEHKAACPVVAIAKTEDWVKRPFMDGHKLT